jgi:hypothetical protein
LIKELTAGSDQIRGCFEWINHIHFRSFFFFFFFLRRLELTLGQVMGMTADPMDLNSQVGFRHSCLGYARDGRYASAAISPCMNSKTKKRK